MGTGIGIDTYGMRDHVGKILCLTVLPNSRLSDAVGHVFLDMVSAFGGDFVTCDGGSELGWLAAFQTTLRETFAPELSAEEWKPVVAVQSSSNIPIESTWSYDRKFNGRNIGDVLEESRIHLIPGDVIHNLQNLAIPVPQEAVQELRGLIETPREEVFRWVSDEFDMLATNIYNGLGSPKLETLSDWAIFNAMAPLIRTEINSAV
ncbi:hypothetical protein DFH08DRAFT_807259 [Mycena albidolilacea]|uniref:Uncharacterized protein n=1 Tax=Mycena albidolilacea TaxID=1033008 RepID=A0AAD7EUA8_9AGAR|nr:hypothetical protein DFH08DRAFT_807259 [Mycena albidolilacea]